MQDKLKRREILLKRILYICAAVYIVTLLYAFYHNYTVKQKSAVAGEYEISGMGAAAFRLLDLYSLKAI